MPSTGNFDSLERLILKWGFLPFFKNDIEQFSIEEFTPEELWFSPDVDGPWEWKGPIIAAGSCAYGKIFQNKAGFVSLDWLPHLLHWRRAHYHATKDEAELLQIIMSHGSLLSTQLKKLYLPPRPPHTRHNRLSKAVAEEDRRRQRSHQQKEGIETALTKLQMNGMVIIADFEYRLDRQGRPYGWGIARYTTAEAMYGSEIMTPVQGLNPETSRDRLMQHLHQLLPQATPKQLQQLVG